MGVRIKVTGYYEPDDAEIDTTGPTGLTEEAYLTRIVDEYGTGIKVADLTDTEIEWEED